MWQNVEKFKGCEYFCKALYTFSVFPAVHLVLYSLQHLLTAVLVTLIYAASVAAGMCLWRDQNVNQFLAVWLNNSAWHPLNGKNDLKKKKGNKSLCPEDRRWEV